jgi:hypothetical protein
VNISAGGDGYGPSDHSSRSTRSGVPVVHLFTGAHEQYHSPEDDAPTLNIEGGAMWHASPPPSPTACAAGPRLGLRAHQRGVADGRRLPRLWRLLRFGAGLFGDGSDHRRRQAQRRAPEQSRREGRREEGRRDRRHGRGITINNLYDMTFVLREHKPGDTIDVVVKRDGQE